MTDIEIKQLLIDTIKDLRSSIEKIRRTNGLQNIILAFVVAFLIFLTYEVVVTKENKDSGITINQEIKTDNKLNNKNHTNNASVGTIDKKVDSRKSLLSLGEK